MKKTLILPLLAIVFALASAFAPMPFAQTGWIHVPPNTNAEGEINNTDKPCEAGRTFQCYIGSAPAYNSPTAANVQNTASLLKYNN